MIGGFDLSKEGRTEMVQSTNIKEKLDSGTKSSAFWNIGTRSSCTLANRDWAHRRLCAPGEYMSPAGTKVFLASLGFYNGSCPHLTSSRIYFKIYLRIFREFVCYGTKALVLRFV